MLVFMFHKKGEVVVENTIKWILVLAVIIAVGYAIRNIVKVAAG